MYISITSPGAHACGSFLQASHVMAQQQIKEVHDTSLFNYIFFDDDDTAMKLVRMMTLPTMMVITLPAIMMTVPAMTMTLPAIMILFPAMMIPFLHPSNDDDIASDDDDRRKKRGFPGHSDELPQWPDGCRPGPRLMSASNSVAVFNTIVSLAHNSFSCPQ